MGNLMRWSDHCVAITVKVLFFPFLQACFFLIENSNDSSMKYDQENFYHSVLFNFFCKVNLHWVMTFTIKVCTIKHIPDVTLMLWKVDNQNNYMFMYVSLEQFTISSKKSKEIECYCDYCHWKSRPCMNDELILNIGEVSLESCN